MSVSQDLDTGVAFSRAQEPLQTAWNRLQVPEYGDSRNERRAALMEDPTKDNTIHED
jgi:hypothetical protein